ncbi:hypothetical protein HRbin01_01241 [archaeon HR01]|nr:hypothetical protein HRbin01_01241 [archaeon HR01]
MVVFLIRPELRDEALKSVEKLHELEKVGLVRRFVFIDSGVVGYGLY